MYAITQGQLEHAIIDLEDHFHVKYDGKTNGECIEELRKLCPKLHSNEELQEYAKDILHKIHDKYGFTGLRTWYRTQMRNAFFGHELLSEKYSKLLKEIRDYINSYREEHDLTLTLDVYILSIEAQKIYKKEYGVLKEGNLIDAYSILRTIHLMYYDEDLIESLTDALEVSLIQSGERYYLNQDLKDKEIIQELFIYFSEELGMDDVYQGHDMFHTYDGYGNIEWSPLI